MGLGTAALRGTAALVPPALRALLAAATLVAAASPLWAKPVSPRDPRILYMGRVAFTDGEEACMGFPGVALRFAYRGPAPTLLLTARTATCYFNLACNGWEPALIHPLEGRSEVPLPTGPAPEEGWVVELTRRTEAWQGLAGFRGLELPEGCELLPPPPFPARKLLVIGDSITCGDQIESLPPEFDLGPRRTNATRSYGMLLGRWLGAQVHLVACGGRGLTRDWRGDRTVANAPQFFQRALPDDPGSAWNHGAYAPDVLVVCLGTNDFNQDLPEEKAFIEACDRFLRQIREVHPNAALVLAESPIFGEAPGTPDRAKRDLLRRCLEGVITLRRQAGDPCIALAPLRHYPGTSADAHPVAFQHEQIALELLPVLKTLTGW